MAIFFKEQDSPGSEDFSSIYQAVLRMNKEKFAQHCDAILHGYRCYEFGEDDTVTDECRYLEQKGCYIPDFYMVNPFYYLGIKEPEVIAAIKNGVIFFRIGIGCDLDNFQIPLEVGVSTDTMESLPVVLFREFDKPIGTEGACDDEEKNYIKKLYPMHDNRPFPGVCEFIGVYKAVLKAADEDSVVFKLTKVFDRYYFDDTKIQTEVSSAAPF